MGHGGPSTEGVSFVGLGRFVCLLILYLTAHYAKRVRLAKSINDAYYISSNYLETANTTSKTLYIS